jgi:hypothetical protein
VWDCVVVGCGGVMMLVYMMGCGGDGGEGGGGELDELDELDGRREIGDKASKAFTLP